MGDLEQFEDLLLRSARNGDIKTLEEILQARKDGKVNLDISCKGKWSHTEKCKYLYVRKFDKFRYVPKTIVTNFCIYM